MHDCTYITQTGRVHFKWSSCNRDRMVTRQMGCTYGGHSSELQYIVIHSSELQYVIILITLFI